MFEKTLDQITPDDVKGLISSQAAEGQNLEFKREPWERSNDGAREMLRDISAMANAYGGYILVGVEEDGTGKAVKLVDVPDAEVERDRITGCCLASLQPRIIGLDVKTLEFETGEHLVLIKVPDSLSLHQITHTGLFQFWKRHDRQKDKMSSDEIKDAILKNTMSLEQSEQLLAKRRLMVRAMGKSRILLCAAPIKLQTELFRINNDELRKLLQYSDNERRDGWNFNFTQSATKPSINGLKVSSVNYKYLELYRNGYFEGMVENASNRNFEIVDIRDKSGNIVQQSRFTNRAVVEYIYSFVKRLGEITQLIGYDSPYTFQLTIQNINGFALPEQRTGSGYMPHNFPIWEETNLELEPLTYESIKPEVIAKELADRVWQAFGLEHEPYFKDGAFDWS